MANQNNFAVICHSVIRTATLDRLHSSGTSKLCRSRRRGRPGIDANHIEPQYGICRCFPNAGGQGWRTCEGQDACGQRTERAADRYWQPEQGEQSTLAHDTGQDSQLARLDNKSPFFLFLTRLCGKRWRPRQRWLGRTTISSIRHCMQPSAAVMTANRSFVRVSWRFDLHIYSSFCVLLRAYSLLPSPVRFAACHASCAHAGAVRGDDSVYTGSFC